MDDVMIKVEHVLNKNLLPEDVGVLAMILVLAVRLGRPPYENEILALPKINSKILNGFVASLTKRKLNVVEIINETIALNKSQNGEV